MQSSGLLQPDDLRCGTFLRYISKQEEGYDTEKLLCNGARQYIEFFKQSGKFSMAYMAAGGEKEYFVGSACEEVYVPPSGSVSLRGLAVSGASQMPSFTHVVLLDCRRLDIPLVAYKHTQAHPSVFF